jgi:hypothetical protein
LQSQTEEEEAPEEEEEEEGEEGEGEVGEGEANENTESRTTTCQGYLDLKLKNRCSNLASPHLWTTKLQRKKEGKFHFCKVSHMIHFLLKYNCQQGAKAAKKPTAAKKKEAAAGVATAAVAAKSKKRGRKEGN